MNKILAVDDSIAICKMMESVLAKAGFSVVTARSGQEGIEELENHADEPFTLVISDIHMDNIGGLDMIKTLRGMDAYVTVPVLVLTTETGDSFKATAKSYGVTGWIVKPFDPRQLLEAVKKVIA